MTESFDVIVVGARCAGALLATMLARDGLRVCVVDKDPFPSDTPSTHGIQPTGIQVLERLGVLDSLLKLAPPILRLRMVFDDTPVPAADVVAITGAPGLSVRRITLDEILINAAADAGAEVRPQTAVTGLVTDGGRVAGVTTSAGVLRAPLVVGADGTRSGEPDEILREWWRWRDEDAWEMYWVAHDIGASGPTSPLRREAERRIAADPELATAIVHEARMTAVDEDGDVRRAGRWANTAVDIKIDGLAPTQPRIATMNEPAVRHAVVQDADAVCAIYNAAISERSSTFETKPRSAADFETRIEDNRLPLLVSDGDSGPIGWAALASYSPRPCYAGIGECNVYVAASARGRGVGTALTEALAAAGEQRGFHKMIGKLFTDNLAQCPPR